MLNTKVISIPRVTHRTAVAAGIDVAEVWAGELGESVKVIWTADTDDLPDVVDAQLREMLIHSELRTEELLQSGIAYRLFFFRQSDLARGDHRDDSDAGLLSD